MLKIIQTKTLSSVYEITDLKDLPSLSTPDCLTLVKGYFSTPVGRTEATIRSENQPDLFQSDNGCLKFGLFGKREILEKILSKLQSAIFENDAAVVEENNVSEGPIQHALLFRIDQSDHFVILGSGTSETLLPDHLDLLDSFKSVALLYNEDDFNPELILDTEEDPEEFFGEQNFKHPILKKIRTYLRKQH